MARFSNNLKGKQLLSYALFRHEDPCLGTKISLYDELPSSTPFHHGKTESGSMVSRPNNVSTLFNKIQ